MIKCQYCDKEFSSYDAVKLHHSAKHPSIPFNIPPSSIQKPEKVGKRTSRRSSKHHLKKTVFIAVIIVAVGVISYVALVPMSSSSTNGSTSSWVGRQAPDFTLPVVSGGTFTLKDYRVSSNVLLFFNEGLSCSPCLKQMVDLNNDYLHFKNLNVTIVAITTDPQSSLQQWAQINGISHIIVLSDQNLQVDRTYQTLGSDVSMMPGSRGGHTFILVDTSGIIKWRADYGPGIMYVSDDAILSNVVGALSLKAG